MKFSDIKLSVIVPNYNGSDFLNSCLRSIIPQLDARSELIFIDDGSEDDSVEVVRSIFSDFVDKNLKLVIQENRGPGSARNTGVRNSTGVYCTFVDSDDRVLDGYINSATNIIDEYNPDAIQYNIVRTDKFGGNKKIIRCHSSPKGCYQTSEVRKEIFGKGKWFPPARIFRRRIILDNLFPEEKVFYEDTASIPLMILSCQNIFLSDETYYDYRLNEGGTTSNHKESHACDLLRLFREFSNVNPVECRNIIRIGIARSIIYFKIELSLENIPLSEIFEEISFMEKKIKILPYIGMPEKILLAFPRIYYALDVVRKKIGST